MKKFDFVIGNPPYQAENTTNGTGMDPVYHDFLNAAFSVGTKVEMIHPARFLFNAGKTPKAWNKKMLEDDHYKVIKYYSNSSEVFSNVEIKGGVAITYRDNETIFGKIGTFLENEEMRNVVKKTNADNNGLFSSIVYPNHSYRFEEKLYEENPWAEGVLSSANRHNVTTNAFRVFPTLFVDQYSAGSIQMYGKDDSNKRVYKWIKGQYIKTPENFEYYKVIVARANGSGKFGETLAAPFVAGEKIGHTDTFISIGKFKEELEAENCLKYIKTKFLRALLSTLKITQDNFAEKWSNIPLQNFTIDSDIDWSKSIHEIDLQLYSKYGLTDEEVSFIEANVKEME